MHSVCTSSVPACMRAWPVYVCAWLSTHTHTTHKTKHTHTHTQAALDCLLTCALHTRKAAVWQLASNGKASALNGNKITGGSTTKGLSGLRTGAQGQCTGGGNEGNEMISQLAAKEFGKGVDQKEKALPLRCVCVRACLSVCLSVCLPCTHTCSHACTHAHTHAHAQKGLESRQHHACFGGAHAHASG